MAFLHEYTVLDELGKGGFATVYKVRHNELGYIRAIRVLNETILDTNSKTYQKFLRECKVLLRLGNGSQPNIVHIYRPRLLENKALVEMDFVDGMDISHFLRKERHFIPVKEVIRMAEQISGALAYCHEDIYRFCMDRDLDKLEDDPNDGSKVLIDEATRHRLITKYKVIHNDIHSGNIMRREDGNFVLLDFGLAINGDEVVRSSRHANGAPEFKSPEKWDDDSILSEQSDIYSFGVVMYEMLAGVVPFPIDSRLPNYKAENSVAEAHQKKTPPSIFDLRKKAFENRYQGKNYVQDYPDWLSEIILKCLAKNPADRFSNGKELNKAISDAVKKANENIIFELQSTIAELCKENEQLQGRLEGTESTITKLRKENELLQKKWEEIQKSLLTSQEETKALQNQLQGQQSQKDQTQHQNQAPENQQQIENTPIVEPQIIQQNLNETFTINGVSFKMLFVEGGTFTMGSADQKSLYNNEKPSHRVTLSEFWMSETAVTLDLFRAFINETGYRTDAEKAGKSYIWGPGGWTQASGVHWIHDEKSNQRNSSESNYPVLYVSWNDASEFCKWLQQKTGKPFCLPTEAQWEFAARGGNKSKDNKYAGSNTLNEVAWWSETANGKPHPVKTKMKNELGLFDMSGNVWEWCMDIYGNYNSSPQTDPAGAIQGSGRVLRGGSWADDKSNCRVTYRINGNPNNRSNNIGFRLALVHR